MISLFSSLIMYAILDLLNIIATIAHIKDPFEELNKEQHNYKRLSQKFIVNKCYSSASISLQVFEVSSIQR